MLIGSLSFCNSNDKFIEGSNEAGYDEKYFFLRISYVSILY